MATISNEMMRCVMGLRLSCRIAGRSDGDDERDESWYQIADIEETLLIERIAAIEDQRDQAVAERDAALARLAAISDLIEDMMNHAALPLTRDDMESCIEVVWAMTRIADLIAPDDADLRPGPSNPLVQTPHPWPLRRDDPDGGPT